MKKSATNVAFWCLVVLALVCGAKETTAVVCKFTELGTCMPEMVGSGAPSDECCVKLREQEPCLCTYIKDPALRNYFKSPNAPKVVAACGVAFPTC